MRRLELTLATPAENLALDEALLDWAEDEDPGWEFLRLWESAQPVVVAGRSTRLHREVNLRACGERNIPIVRRSSGGAAIVAGPGCLMYALVLSYQRRPELRDIRRAHAFVLDRFAESLQTALSHLGSVLRAGTSDLALEQNPGRVEVAAKARRGGENDSVVRTASLGASSICKFSGNSLRVKRTHLLYHGTFLYDFDLSLIDLCLPVPPRTPAYRASRAHGDFLRNVPMRRESLVAAVDSAWPTTGPVLEWPTARVAALVAERFGRDRWTYEFA